jgi:hypothetical protein
MAKQTDPGTGVSLNTLSAFLTMDKQFKFFMSQRAHV